MDRKKHVEEMLNNMINDVNYIKLSTYQITRNRNLTAFDK